MAAGKAMTCKSEPMTTRSRALIASSAASWVGKPCARAAAELDTKALLAFLAARETAKAEDLMRGALVAAEQHFNRMYKG